MKAKATYRHIPITYSLLAFSALSYAQHNSDGLGSISDSNGGSAMSLSDISNNMNMINDQFGAEITNAQAELIQAQNAFDGCALNERQALDDAQAAIEDAEAEGKGKALTSAIGAAAPSLMQAVQQGMGGANSGKQYAKDNLQGIGDSVAGQYRNFVGQYGQPSGAPEPQNFVDTSKESQAVNQTYFSRLYSSVGTASTTSLCDKNRIKTANPNIDEQSINQLWMSCRQDASSLQNTINSAKTNMRRYEEEIKQGGFLNAQMLGSLATASISYLGTKQAVDASIDAAKREADRTKKTASAGRGICERNNKAAIDMATKKIADLNLRKKRALDNLARMSSQPLPNNSDSDVPVEGGDTMLGGLPTVGTAEALSNPSKAGEESKTAAAAPASSGNGGGASSGGGGADVGSPAWTFSEGGGFPGGSGLPAQPGGGKFAAIDGGGAGGGGFGGGFSDPYGAFGYDEGMADGDRSLAGMAEAPMGDGGLNLMVMRARMRYGTHAAVLLRQMDLKKMAKSSEEQRNRQPASIIRN